MNSTFICPLLIYDFPFISKTSFQYYPPYFYATLVNFYATSANPYATSGNPYATSAYLYATLA